MSGTIVLAFSGGLDTSFCVPYLKDQGFDVVTLFVDTGGVTPQKREWIGRRALELGAVDHVTEDAADELWETFVTPFVMGGVAYQDQYPLLCSDRYVIASRAVALADRVGAVGIGHGCTAMGNDQVRFDHSLHCLTALPIHAPIREIQATTRTPRAYEMEYLRNLGFEVSADVSRYTMNENLLGVTVSGSEIDEFGAPGPESYRITAPPGQWPDQPVRARIGFRRGEAVMLDGRQIDGPDLLRTLHERFGPYGVGRGLYTGDTVIGLKGRIVFESPGIAALLTAHRALEEAVLSREQNAFKPKVARKWTDLVYSGYFFEPLRSDLEAFIRSTQERVSGEVTLESHGGAVNAIAIESRHILRKAGAVYAQSADWTAADAEGFIRLSGLSSAMAAAAGQQRTAPAGKEAVCASES